MVASIGEAAGAGVAATVGAAVGATVGAGVASVALGAADGSGWVVSGSGDLEHEQMETAQIAARIAIISSGW